MGRVRGLKKGKLKGGCLRLSVVCKVSSSLSLSLSLLPSRMMLTTHFYPFLTIFLEAHAPIIISFVFSFVFRGGMKMGGKHVPPSGVFFHICQKSSSSEWEPICSLLRDVFVRLRLLINICIFLTIVWESLCDEYRKSTYRRVHMKKNGWYFHERCDLREKINFVTKLKNCETLSMDDALFWIDVHSTSFLDCN